MTARKVGKRELEARAKRREARSDAMVRRHAAAGNTSVRDTPRKQPQQAHEAELDHAQQLRDGHEETYYDALHQRAATQVDKLRDAWGCAAGEHEDAAAQFGEVFELLTHDRKSEAMVALRKAERQSVRAERAVQRAENVGERAQARAQQVAARNAARNAARAEREAARKAKQQDAARVTERYRADSGAIVIWRRQ